MNKFVLLVLMCLCFSFSYADDICYEYIDNNMANEYKNIIVAEKNFTGLGKLYIAGKGCYMGQFKEGYPSGKGMIVWPDFTSYIGEFKAGSADGYGVFQHRFGWAYKGTWSANWPDEGSCLNGNVEQPCYSINSDILLKEWNSHQVIKIFMLYERYFHQFNLLSEAKHLRGGLFFKGNEYTLSIDNFKKNPSVYYSGKNKRKPSQLKKSISYHKPFLKSILQDFYKNNSVFKGVAKIVLMISPKGNVVGCSVEGFTSLTKLICEEVKSIDFGIVDSDENMKLVLKI